MEESAWHKKQRSQLEDSLWKLEKQFQELQEYRQDLQRIWQDDAATNFNTYYFRPHEEDSKQALVLLNQQLSFLEESSQNLQRLEQLILEANYLSENIQELINSAKQAIDSFHHDYSNFIEQNSNAEHAIPAIENLISLCNNTNNRNVTWLSEEDGIYRTSRNSIIGPYSKLKKWIPKNLPDRGLEEHKKYIHRNAHHIIPKEHASKLFPSRNTNEMPSVNVSRRYHIERLHEKLNHEMMQISRRFPNSQNRNRKLPDMNKPEVKNQVWNAYERVYAEHPDWLDAIRDYFE